MVASRPELVSVTTFLKSLSRYALPSVSVPPFFTTEPQAASAFQRAAPDEAGLAVTTPTPGLTRSSQPWMFFGLPLRTPSTTTEVDTMPLFGPSSHVGSTRPAFPSRCTSVPTDRWT